MNSIYASEQFCQEIWPDFSRHFRNQVSAMSYYTDVVEFMQICETDFLCINEKMVKAYYEKMSDDVKKGNIQASTMAKKFRELHSLAKFIYTQQEKYNIPENFQDYFIPYLKIVAKNEKYARVIPIEHIDKLLSAAQKDSMVYCILVFLYRVGLSSTEIIKLKIKDFTFYENGVYVNIIERREPCFVPEDAYLVLEKYLTERKENEYLFYNSQGNKLNTMYISRLMKKYTQLADIPRYSAEALRNSCAFTMFAYQVSPEQVAAQLGITSIQIKRYKNTTYKNNILQAANKLVKIKVEPPN